jgi:hypothetical protein
MALQTTPRTGHSSFAVKNLERRKNGQLLRLPIRFWPRPTPMIGVLLLWGALNAYAKRKGIPVEELWQSSCACAGGGDTVAVDDNDQQEQSLRHQEGALDEPPQPSSSSSASFHSFISSISL